MTGRAIVLATGGTGGHVFPAQALAEALGARGWRLMLVTDRRGAGYSGPLGALETHRISAAGVSGRGLFARAGAALRLALGYVQARALLKRVRPAAVIGFGGYPSVPTVLAAAGLKLKTGLHEQNAVLGRANRLLAPRVKRIALSFDPTALLRPADRDKSRVTGNPVRPEIAALAARPYAPPRADGPIHLLCVGGSQGAQVFGETLPAALARLPAALRARIRLTLQTRADQVDGVAAGLAETGVAGEVRAFFDDMPARLAQAHLAIARAGASTTSELAASGRPALLVPYPHAIDDHQSANAARLCDAGGAWMIPQADFTADMLAQRLEDLLTNPPLLAQVAAAARRVGIPEATERLADWVEALVAGAPSAGEARP